LEMHFGAHINVCHVAGKRMIAQGSDGLSRGNLNVGVMAGMKDLFCGRQLWGAERFVSSLSE